MKYNKKSGICNHFKGSKRSFGRPYNYLSRIIHILDSRAISYCVIHILPSTSSASTFPPPDGFFINLINFLRL